MGRLAHISPSRAGSVFWPDRRPQLPDFVEREPLEPVAPIGLGRLRTIAGMGNVQWVPQRPETAPRREEARDVPTPRNRSSQASSCHFGDPSATTPDFSRNEGVPGSSPGVGSCSHPWAASGLARRLAPPGNERDFGLARVRDITLAPTVSSRNAVFSPAAPDCGGQPTSERRPMPATQILPWPLVKRAPNPIFPVRPLQQLIRHRGYTLAVDGI